MMFDKEGIRKALVLLVDGRSEKHIGKKKHRVRVVLVATVILTVLTVALGLYVGPTAFTTANMVEVRLPRLLAAFCVGIGLSVAGAVYQAIIRNPLVDPYIMGVSSGAGTFAIAALSFNFTFFGLISAHSPFLTALCVIAGGLIAFATTMVLARCSGGTTNAYVLSGVIIGLVFGAMQTAMLVFAGDNVANALLWLFGSFKDINWTHIPIIAIPTVFITVIILRYSKELNLVLLGEDQAKQMGLDVRRFNAFLLILASVLTSFCVAFVGIIGFVGLVVPHLCRMIFGGDHRIVLPASIAMGGVMMALADLLARMILVGQEFPVGAVTTLIGVPMFAYLLFKRGKIYNG